MKTKVLQLKKEVNPHFYNYVFDWQHRFYFVFGGYGSSKSYNTAFKIILKCLEEKRTVLVVREVYDTHRDSTYSLLSEIIDDLGLGPEGAKLCKYSESPMRFKFRNGSKIIFKGMDKPRKLKSINGVTIVWLEECSEIKYSGFKELLGRLRHPTLPLHFILTTNPVGKENWCYKHFFARNGYEVNDEDVYRQRVLVQHDVYFHHSLADDNLFLPQDYIDQLDEMQSYDPDLWRVARQGRFGVNGKVVLPQFQVMPHEWIVGKIAKISKYWYRTGMDFGFEESYNAVVRMVIDDENKDLYIWWEYYKNGMTDAETIKDPMFRELKKDKDFIHADSAEPKAIKFYRDSGYSMVAAEKFPGSRLQDTKKVKRFHNIYCSDQCVHCIAEMKELTYKKDIHTDELIYDEFNIDPHTFSAVWYGLSGYEVADLKKQNYGFNISI